MPHDWLVIDADERAVARIAEAVALKIRPGDTILLHGDLGAGKTTLARSLVRSLIGDPLAEVPSPTFPILQVYDTPRLTVAHLDLYRISGEAEVDELGLGELLETGAIVVEWPERVAALAAADRLDIHLSEGSTPDRRTVRLAGHGSWEPRLLRLAEIVRFLDCSPEWRGAALSYLQGDASSRTYARVSAGGRAAILMDWPRQPDGPPIRNGLPYSRIAHLAEGVPAFVDVAQLLISKGFSAPRILAQDLDRGLLVIEDLGERVFGREAAAGKPLRQMWEAAVDALVALRSLIGIEHIARTGGTTYAIPAYDRRALAIEIELLADWYWPLVKGQPISTPERDTLMALWATVLDPVLAAPAGITLRDYHSPNLLWLPERGTGVARVGIIDFQDAVRGHPAYDLVSLLQDARLDVPENLEAGLLEHYLASVETREAGFHRHAFTAAYATLGAQRNTKILGIFARLARRDSKPQYLQHIPRIWRYLERDLAHPQLAMLRAWYDRNFPPSQRARVLER